MRNIESKDRFRIWEVNDNDGYAIVQMSESRKLKEEDSFDMSLKKNGVSNGKEYISTQWNYVRFVGRAYEKLKNLDTSNQITHLIMDVNKEPYFGDKNAEINSAISLLEKRGVIREGEIARLPREEGTVFPRQPRITVFNFKLASEVEDNSFNSNEATKKIDKAPTVEVADTNKYQEPTSMGTPVYINENKEEVSITASDKCPF